MPTTSRVASAARAKASSSPSRWAASTTLREARTASGALALITSANSRAASRAWPGSTSRFTRPCRWADSAERSSPVRASSMATFRGRALGRRKRPPAFATSDRFTSGRPNLATLLATTRSQESTISVPPATAGPSTAAIRGLVRVRRTRPAKPPRSVESLAEPEAIALRSAPAQNDGPLPHRIPIHRSASDSRRSIAASRSSASCWLTALRASGRFSVMIATRPRTSKVTVMPTTLPRGGRSPGSGR